ncbi:xanthine dehydrogenase family protein molybdopterin-binding subunit [Pseudoteredinibacter isoporae]|uniref:xanthine dehydrogenase family protein molybdopterin-binding subunit n=1 Tax=Pseudoteredinibacter isoporae TaxID=570281 RepID=UPI003102463F
MSQSNMAIQRRSFLKLLGAGGLMLSMPALAKDKPLLYSQGDALVSDGVLQITPAGEIIFLMPRAEMGQGTNTGLSMLIAEELNTPPELITILHAGVGEPYKNPLFGMQMTGGSTSIMAHYEPLRKTAATAREMIVQAASEKLNMDPSSLQLRDGKLWLAEKAYSLGDFVERASQIKPPTKVVLKSNSSLRFIGKPQKKVDGLAKVTGQARFGIDVGSPSAESVINGSDQHIPNLKRAALLRCPVIGGEVKTVDASAAKALPGVIDVVTIFNGVAVVAEHYWQARKALTELKVEWNLPELAKQNSADIRRAFEKALSEDGQTAFEEGDSRAAIAKAGDNTLTADYHVPYLAHATMEPMNCTVWLQDDVADVWVPTQGPDVSQTVASEHCDVPRDNIRVHSTFLGGGFGRRVNQDYVAEAVAIAKASGYPIQLVWSREDDMKNDFYRPAASARMSAAMDENGQLQAWDVTRVGPNIMGYTIDEAAGMYLPEFLPGGFVDWISKRGHGIFENWTVDPSSVEGLWEEYSVANKTVRQVTIDPGLRLGFWRSVGHSFSGFFKEGFMDELAEKAEIDPLDYRLQHCGDMPRLAAALKKVADMSHWKQREQLAAQGRYLGIASVFSFNSYVAQVAEVSVEGGQIKVHKVYCVADCGRVVNPDGVAAQIEGGIVFGLSAALSGTITLKDGVVEQSNFHDYPVVRMSEAPDIELHIVPSTQAPTGAGEPAVPPIAPAVANAVFAASGQRLRELPLRLA